VRSRSDDPPVVPRSARTTRGVGAVGIPQRLLVACGPFGPHLSATAAASAIARGILDGGRPEPDICVLELAGETGENVRSALDDLGFDARMRRARAVIVGAERLEERTLAGSVTFEIATRARQGGIPSYAVTGENALDEFDARILDLQLILQARSRGALGTAGRKLAGLS
jgi:glycerate kinase